MNSRRMCLPIGAALCVLIFSAEHLCGAIAYTVTDLGTLGGGPNYAYSINNSGIIVGESNGLAFLYDGTMHDLGAGYGSRAWSVSENGKIAGSASFGSAAHPFLYDGMMHDLGSLGGYHGEGTGVNNSGQVTGFSAIPNLDYNAFLYDGVMHDLGTLGSGGRDSYGEGINESGAVTGYSHITARGPFHAFLYDGTMHDLGVLTGSTYSFGSAINNSGLIAGYCGTTEYANFRAFVYDGTMHDLGVLPGTTESVAHGINKLGAVVGVSGNNLFGNFEHAFLWTSSDGMRDLNSMIDPQSGWVLYQGFAINDVGQIVGNGNKGAFLLTPVPEPASFVLLGIGAAGLLFCLSMSLRQPQSQNHPSTATRPPRKTNLHFSLILATIAALGARAANAQTPTTLFDFDSTHGANPEDSLTLGGSTLYGTTALGGANNQGTIFSIPVTGGTPTTLFSFDGAMHGSDPAGNLTLSGSTLYGMTYSGGTSNYGTIFSIPIAGGTPTTLFNFDSAHGAYPLGSLTLSGSTLYGMTILGGANDHGTIFSIPVTGGTPTTLFSFDGAMHGQQPLGSLTLIGSTLYGMTYSGGTSNYGTIFSISVTGGTPTVLFNFDMTHGANPEDSLMHIGSMLYGTTTVGGAHNQGTIFSIPVTGGTPTTLFSFDGAMHGSDPAGNLTLSGSTLYGMTYSGGTSNYGTIFSIPIAGGTPNVLFSFDYSPSANGALPYGSLTLSGSTLYGMTTFGGSHGLGVVFSLAVPEPSTFALAALGGSLWLVGRSWRRGALGKSRLILSEAIASRGKEASMP